LPSRNSRPARAGWRSAKHAKQWRASLDNYAMRSSSLISVNMRRTGSATRIRAHTCARLRTIMAALLSALDQVWMMPAPVPAPPLAAARTWFGPARPSRRPSKKSRLQVW